MQSFPRSTPFHTVRALFEYGYRAWARRVIISLRVRKHTRNGAERWEDVLLHVPVLQSCFEQTPHSPQS